MLSIAAALLHILRLVHIVGIGGAAHGEALVVVTSRPPALKFLVHFHNY